MNQKEGVFVAVRAVFPEGKVPETGAWTTAQKEQVHGLLFRAFKAGEVEYKGGCPADGPLAKYIPGLVNNWVRKDTRLNGGSKYEAKRPGSRSGSGDESVKNMRILLTVTQDPDAKAQIQAEIDRRMAELNAAKAPVIDVSKLPENLRHLAVTAVPPSVRRAE